MKLYVLQQDIVTVSRNQQPLDLEEPGSMDAAAKHCLNDKTGNCLTYELVGCHLIQHVVQPTEVLHTRADGDEQ